MGNRKENNNQLYGKRKLKHNYRGHYRLIQRNLAAEYSRLYISIITVSEVDEIRLFLTMLFDLKHISVLLYAEDLSCLRDEKFIT